MSGYVQIKKECILSLLRNSFNNLVDEIHMDFSPMQTSDLRFGTPFEHNTCF